MEKGMTLTEVVVAAALVALCIGGILAVLTQNADLGQSVDYAYTAANIAKSRMERVREIRRDMGYSNLPDAAETDTAVNQDGVSDPNGNYMRTTIVSADEATDLTTVTVRVKYKKRGIFIPASIELVTMISEHA